MYLSSEQVLGPDGRLAPGWVRVDEREGVIESVGAGSAPGPVELSAAYLLPGLVDMHCHGGAGANLATTDPDEARTALALHRHQGTTCLIASLVTAEVSALEVQLRTLAPLVTAGELAGLHLEGPWLSPHHLGAHDPDLVHPPTAQEVERLLEAAQGQLRVVTLAPELPGAMETISTLRQAGVVVAVGHTDCDADQLRAAVRAGASVVTHLCNAMRPIHHRDPGPITAALATPGLTVELIVDGVHIHPDVVALLHRASRARVALITDAMAAAGCGDGAYQLGGQTVEVTDGTARLTGGGSIAGSTLTLDRALRTAHRAGVPVQAAAVAATRTPAATLGLPQGQLRPQAPADLLALDEDLLPVAVWHHGQRIR